MAKATILSAATVQAQGDALARLLDNGYLRIYSGAQPADADIAIDTQVLLVALRFAATSAPPTDASGLITFNAIAPAIADNTDTATWFRAFQSDGTTPVMDGTCDVAANSPNLALTNTGIVAGTAVQVTTMTHQIQKTTAGL